MYRTIVTILFGVFIPIYTFAGYDGRLADDPYHTSPTWLYLLLAVGLFVLIGKWAKKRNRKRKSSTSTPATESVKLYKDTGRYWKTCPICKGTGYVVGKQSFKFPSVSGVISLGNVICDKCKGFCHEFTPTDISLYEELKLLEQKESEESEQKRVDNPAYSKFDSLLSLWGIPKDNTEPRSDALRNRLRHLVENEPYCLNCMAKGYVEVWQDENGNAYERIGCHNCHGQGKIFFDCEI